MVSWWWFMTMIHICDVHNCQTHQYIGTCCTGFAGMAETVLFHMPACEVNIEQLIPLSCWGKNASSFSSLTQSFWTVFAILAMVENPPEVLTTMSKELAQMYLCICVFVYLSWSPLPKVLAAIPKELTIVIAGACVRWLKFLPTTIAGRKKL